LPLTVGPAPFISGTCRALITVFGQQVIVCHRCRKYVIMPALDVPLTLLMALSPQIL